MEKTKKLIAYLIDGEKSRPIEIEDDLEEFYKLLNCRTIDIITRPIAGKAYDFIIDDEGRIDGKPAHAVYYKEIGEKTLAIENICGPFLIVNAPEDGSGEKKPLTDDDLKAIYSQLWPWHFFTEGSEKPEEMSAWLLVYGEFESQDTQDLKRWNAELESEEGKKEIYGTLTMKDSAIQALKAFEIVYKRTHKGAPPKHAESALIYKLAEPETPKKPVNRRNEA